MGILARHHAAWCSRARKKRIAYSFWKGKKEFDQFGIRAHISRQLRFRISFPIVILRRRSIWSGSCSCSVGVGATRAWVSTSILTLLGRRWNVLLSDEKGACFVQGRQTLEVCLNSLPVLCWLGGICRHLDNIAVNVHSSRRTEKAGPLRALDHPSLLLGAIASSLVQGNVQIHTLAKGL